MKRETRKQLSDKDLRVLGVSSGLVVRRIRPQSDEEILGRIHEEDIEMRHFEEDYLKRAIREEG